MNLAQGKLYKPLLIAAAVLLLTGVSFVQKHLNRARLEMGLTRIEPLENAPPVLAFTTVALGGFRGLIANTLWIRATELQEEDKYFEMVQLADWITKLQPHFVTVWVHQAWNMAYNISIKFDDPQHRWLWVKRGIELLRDDGLRFNPKEPLIYRELAWFFQHKMGHNLDDAHNYYKSVWAKKMDELFEGGQPDWQELLQPETEEAKERVRILREEYKMSPALMKEVDETYGPLEWRLPETHAIYWAMVGIQNTLDNELRKNDLIQLRRVIFQSMQLAFHRGKLFYLGDEHEEFFYGPNLEIVGKANQAYEDMMEEDERMRFSIENGHKNFLRTAVYFLYTHNERAKAQKWFDYLQEKYPTALLNQEQLDFAQENPRAPLPKKSLNQYALERVAEDIGETSVDRVKTILLGLLEQSFVSLAIGNEDQAVGMSQYATAVRNRYQEALGTMAQTQKRVGMPPMAELKAEALNQLLNPTNGLVPELNQRLRGRLGLPAEGPVRLQGSEGGGPTNAPSPGAASNPR